MTTPHNYTHNLKLLFVDNNGNIIDDEIHMNEIKTIFNEPQSCILEYNQKRNVFTIEWKQIQLNKIQTQFMGDLFTNPIYEKDSIIYRHTKKIINNIKCKYRIVFYISRLIADIHYIPDFIDFV